MVTRFLVVRVSGLRSFGALGVSGGLGVELPERLLVLLDLGRNPKP